MKKSLKLFFLILDVCFLSVGRRPSDLRYVDTWIVNPLGGADFATIQAGDQRRRARGDTIEVAAGTYPETA